MSLFTPGEAVVCVDAADIPSPPWTPIQNGLAHRLANGFLQKSQGIRMIANFRLYTQGLIKEGQMMKNTNSSERSDNNPYKNRVYVAGPVTGKPERNQRTFTAEAMRLRALGYTVFIPTEFVSPNSSWNDAMRRCIQRLVLVNDVVLLPGWMWSRGARREWIIAKLLKIRTHRTGWAG